MAAIRRDEQFKMRALDVPALAVNHSAT